ncbi:MAG: class I SAM-dependent methyltransferase, partial [Phycisphaerae bacterium]
MLKGIREASPASLAVLFAAMMSVGAVDLRAAEADARKVLEAAGVKGGLLVHVGCGDGKLTAALGASDSFLVHGLDADAANVEKAREHIRS